MVFSVDPSMGPDTKETAEKYQRHNSRHRSLPKALGVVVEGRSSSSAGGGEILPFQKAYALPEKYSVISLEQLAKEMGTTHFDVVRMDCEGAELRE